MNESQIARLIREHNETAVGEFKRLLGEVGALREEVKILRRIVASGAQLEFPWFKLPTPRRKQVEAVVAYLQAHRNREIYTVRRAAFDTFVPVEGGYPTPVALASYCYDIKLDNWITDSA